MKDTIVLSCFPLVGKSYLYDHQKELGLTILDSDSSSFSWTKRRRTEEELDELKKEWDNQGHALSGEKYLELIKNRLINVRNPEFPNNYIAHIKENIGKVDIILVSSHENVRKALQEGGIKYRLVYPSHLMKFEWIGRSWVRENTDKQGFTTKLLYAKWDEWIESCKNDQSKAFMIDSNNCYLMDILYDVIIDTECKLT